MPRVDSCEGEEGRCGEDYPASTTSVVVFTEDDSTNYVFAYDAYACNRRGWIDGHSDFGGSSTFMVGAS